MSWNDIALLVLGGIVGVACNEVWRYLRPPEELRLLREMHAKMIQAPPKVAIEGKSASLLSRLNRHRREGLFGSVANALAWLSLVGAFLVGARSEVTAYALFAAFVALACASIYFRRRAKRALA